MLAGEGPAAAPPRTCRAAPWLRSGRFGGTYPAAARAAPCTTAWLRDRGQCLKQGGQMTADAADQVFRPQDQAQHQFAVRGFGDDQVLELSTSPRHVKKREPGLADERSEGRETGLQTRRAHPHSRRSTPRPSASRIPRVGFRTEPPRTILALLRKLAGATPTRDGTAPPRRRWHGSSPRSGQ